MTFRIPSGIAEAARLTRTGNLTEATALIQRVLQGQDDRGSGRTDRTDVIDGEYVRLDRATPGAAGPAAGGGGRPHARPRAGLGETLRNLAARARPVDPRHAPDPLPEGASFRTASYANAAGSRSYKLYIPASRTDQRLPLVVLLHGCTQSPDDFAAGTRMNVLAEQHGCLVAYPAQTASANPQKCWNWFNPDDQRRGSGEPSLIAGITHQIMRDHRVDESRIYIAGLSAGGAAAVVMGATYPDLYAAAGVHSGLPAGAAEDVPSAFAAMRRGGTGRRPSGRGIPTIVFHGDQDATVHPRNADAIVAQSMVSAAGLRPTVQRGQVPGGRAYTRAVHADDSCRTFCELWTIHGAGHAWAGGSPSGSYTDPQGPDAMREMLRFFFQHRHAVSERP